MPRPRKAARLWLRRASGKAPAAWIILDGGKQYRIDCGAEQRAEAERRFAEYIAEKHETPRLERRIAEIPIADVIRVYSDDVASLKPEPAKIAKRLERLLLFWGDKPLSAVNGANCRAYARARGNDGGARRDLQDLSAAIQHHHREGYHRELIRVWLPRKGKPRERFLTRDEIARLVWAAWRAREVQEGAGTGKRTGKHIARAILLAYYTGSRIGTVLAASWLPGIGRSFIDLDNGVFYRLPTGKAETNKRQPPVRLSMRIMAHIRRWRDSGECCQFAVEWHARPVKSIKVGFSAAVRKAGLGSGVSPHTLRHSRATHMMQDGVAIWEAAGALGMSDDILRRVYGHHHPDHQKNAVNAR